MTITRESILDLLEKIQDPDLKLGLVTADLVDDIQFTDQTISVTISITNPALHARKRMQEAVIFNLGRALGNEITVSCQVNNKQIDTDKKVRSILPDVKKIIAIASGKGGVGKSTITSNIAGGLAKKGFRVGIIDADIYGPSIPTMFDLVGKRPKMIDVNDKQLIEPIINYGIKILSIGFFTDQDNAVVWRGPMASKALTQMITDAHWGELDFLLVDLPPGTGDVHLSLIQTAPLDGVVIVSTPQEVALADARRGINMFKMDGIKVPIIGVIENMAWFTPEELPQNKYYIFGRDGAKNLASGMNVPFLGAIPLVQSLREAGDAGRPAVFQDDTIMSIAFDELVNTFITELASLDRQKSQVSTNG
jgi:ATP-binding protein involved in chromosome partitioning